MLSLLMFVTVISKILRDGSDTCKESLNHRLKTKQVVMNFRVPSGMELREVK